MTGSKPRKRIPPTTLIRRSGRQKRHIQLFEWRGGYARTECGQVFRLWPGESSITTNAADIDCYECLADAVSRRLREQRPVPKVTI